MSNNFSLSWKHRLYAFLLRRALGPLLTTKSAADLRSSIQDVDWSKGKLVLVDVELDPDYLTRLFAGKGHDDGGCDDAVATSSILRNIAVTRARIRRFEIHLSLCDSGDQSTSRSTARKATSALLRSIFGSGGDEPGDSSYGTALVAHVELAGLDVELAPVKRIHQVKLEKNYTSEPCMREPTPLNTTLLPIVDQEAETSGFFSSLVDSALKSLRLSVELSDVSVRMFSQHCDTTTWNEVHCSTPGIKRDTETIDPCCVTLQIALARYYDSIESRSETPANKPKLHEDKAEKLVLSKTLDWCGLVIQTEQRKAVPIPILRSSGEGRILFRVYEQWYHDMMDRSCSLSGRQEIDISLGYHISTDVDVWSLTRLIVVSNALTSINLSDNEDHANEVESEDVAEYFTPRLALADEFTREAYDKVMKQYTEARHLARTRELRGGLLIPSFDEDYGGSGAAGEISFDAFFDANDHSVSYYCDLLDEKWNTDKTVALTQRPHVHTMTTKVDFGMSEFTLKIQLNVAAALVTKSPEFILISLGDLRVLISDSASAAKINCSISHFDIESQLLTADSTTQSAVNESILRFVDLSEKDTMLVSSPPSISAYIELFKVPDAKDKANEFEVDLILQPLEIIYDRRAVSWLTDLTTKIEDRPRRSSSKEIKSSGEITYHMSVSCGYIVVMMPCERFEATHPDALFARCGYQEVEQRGTPFLGIGLELDNVSADFSNKSDEESTAVTKFSNAILFAKGVQLEPGCRGRRRFASSFVSRRTDLVACTTNQDRSSDSFITLSCARLFRNCGKQSTKRKSSFPMILPLEKARQENDDADHDCDRFNDTLQSRCKKRESSNIDKATDPQFIMSSEASEAGSEIIMHVPFLCLDITLDERLELINIISSFSSQTIPKKIVPRKDDREWCCVAFNVGQLSIVLYGCEEMNSYSLVCDNMQVHTLMENFSGFRNARVALADITLYELSEMDVLSKCHRDNSFPTSCAVKSKRVQNRLMVNRRCSESKAIFFRSKLSQPLSPEYPAILIDALIRKRISDSHEMSDDECDEKSIHVSVYDMTYRYCVGSNWLQNFSRLVEGQSGQEESVSRDGQEDESEPSLTNLFFNFADCNVDYTTPFSYKTASRSVLRIGEVHLSSNIFTPSDRAQSCKVSLSDVDLHICNFRHPYKEENSLLSCAHRHFNEDDMHVHGIEKRVPGKVMVTLNGALSCMDFINVATIDSVDAVILILYRGSKQNQGSVEPATTVALTIGTIQCNFCKDSFSCLVDTLNEWLIRFTALSDAELENLKSTFEPKSKVGVVDEIQTKSTHDFSTPSIQQSIDLGNERRRNSTTSIQPITEATISRDDSTSIDLTKSLLFQNYYTFHAKNSYQTAIQGQQTAHHVKTVVESPSSDDEWATVEHEYLRHSSLPRENDQSSQWYVFDKEAMGDGKDAQSPNVKIYPQHISAKPAEPLDGGLVDAAKITGTRLALEIGLRLIVRDSSIVCRFFDGLDWIKLRPQKRKVNALKDRKQMLLSGLIDEEGQLLNRTLAPMPGERSEILKCNTARKNLRRNVHRCFSLFISGLKLNQDAYADSAEHQLASCMDLSMADFFIAETISSKDPVKMIGEWVNEVQHPRDDNDGVVMLKMITHHPTLRVSADGKLMSDESRAMLELLPLRCYFHQTAIRFIRSFFSRDHLETATDHENTDETNVGEDEIIPVFFTSFKVAPCKLKVDYTPEEMDLDSFREGNYVEILNLCPLEEMILNLQAVENHDLTGWGSVVSELASRWIEDICSTQSHKFFTRATPVQFFSGVTEGVADLAMVLVVPESGSFADYLKDVLSSSTSFAGKVACEVLNTSAKMTRFAANQLNTKALPSASSGSMPARPKTVPRHVADAAGHGYKSISRGLREANYKIVTVPLREYQQRGAGGAALSAVHGLPIAILAPLSGASEALSYTLLGLRNSLRPDLRKEDEASLRGLHFE
ncbi:hypothetical protein ACHAW6_012661 [Cyclotella cf. meneghiniana]